MQNKRFVYLLVTLVLIVLIVTCANRSNPVKSKQELNYMTFLELIRSGYDLIEDDRNFSQICEILNDTLSKKKESTVKLTLMNHIVMMDDSINSINWDVAYDNSEIGPVSSLLTFFVDIRKNGDIKIHGTLNSISNLRDLAREYIFYPDDSAREIVKSKKYIKDVGEVETSLAAPIIVLHLPQEGSLSISDWRFFFSCLHELIELFEDERNKTSLQIFNKSYDSLSFEEKDKIVEVAGYNIRIWIK